MRERLRDRTLTHTVRAGLLDVLGQLCVHVRLDEDEPPEGTPYPLIDALDVIRTGAVRASSSEGMVDPDGAIEAWTDFVELAPKAPLIPTRNLADMLALLAPALVEHAGWRKLVEASDELIAVTAGDSAAAGRSRDRALAFLADDRPLEALADMHEAKARWWNGDTIRGALLALLILQDCYRQLGLPLAARYQALTAFGLAQATDAIAHADLIIASMMKVAHTDYSTGAWCDATVGYAAAVHAHAVLHDDEPWDISEHEDL